MRISQRGIDLVKRHEGVLPYAYNDPVGHCTVGVGHLLHQGNCTAADYERWGSKSKRKLSAKRVDDLLRDDLRSFEACVHRAVKVALNQCEFDALVSLAFNIGCGALADSTVIRRLNEGKRYEAGRAFLMWNKAGGKVLPGLVTRRNAERRLFRSTACGQRKAA